MAFTRRGFLIVALEELVLFAFDKAFLTRGGWQEVKCVYWKVFAGLKSVRTSRMDSFLNLPLYTDVSRKVISVSEISAVNFMVVLNRLFVGKISGKWIFTTKTKSFTNHAYLRRKISRHIHSGIHESRSFLSKIHASRTNFRAHHASRINAFAPSKNKTSIFFPRFKRWSHCCISDHGCFRKAVIGNKSNNWKPEKAK